MLKAASVTTSEAVETGLGDDIDHTRTYSGVEIRHELNDEKIEFVHIDSRNQCGVRFSFW